MTHKAKETVWYPAVYARLSDEDKESKKNDRDVSLSITHQIDILTGYVEDMKWQDPKIFYDDDRTGTNFNREGFQAMYAEVQKGTVNVIVIKDTSRFGRNWVQSGVYFEKIEQMGVRFVSIQEGIDTIDPKCPALKMLPFYFIFAEWHSQTTSEKIRAVFKKQAEQGKHRTKHAPYGYAKDPADKYKLIVDPETEGIVKRIFEMRLDKMSFGSIARKLNDEGVLSPGGYSAEKHGTKHKRVKVHKWSANSIIDITSNQEYCGDVINNRVGGKDYKNRKQVRKPPGEWIIVPDMHTPLVSREDFQKCANMREGLGRVRSTQYADISPFTGLLICPDCKYKMQRTSTYYTVKTTGEKKILIAYNCGAYANMGKTACTSHYVLENDLKELVLADIHEKADKIIRDEKAARERFYTFKAHTSGTKLNTDKNALKKVNKRLEELDILLLAAFEKSVLGDNAKKTAEAVELANTYKEYERKYQLEKQELTKQAKVLSASIDKHSKTEKDVETFIALLKKYASVTELDRATAVELIDHITVSASTVKPREIVIHYNLMGNVD